MCTRLKKTVKWDRFIEYTNKLYILRHCFNIVCITAEKVHINRWVISSGGKSTPYFLRQFIIKKIKVH